MAMRYLIGFALLLPMVVFAKDPPLPEALLNSKTAFVEKAGNAAEYFDRYCKSLKKDAKADKQFLIGSAKNSRSEGALRGSYS
jgi:hypothetical protein